MLGCAVAESLYRSTPGLAEGQLSRLRAELIREESLARIAGELGIPGFMRLDESTSKNGGASRPSLLADTLEAIYGAVFLDGGYEAARAAIAHTYGRALAEADAATLQKDPKTRLQEYLHARGLRLPQYRIVGSSGPMQSQTFEVECQVADAGLKANGSGSTRQRAEQQAAGRLLELLGA